MSWDTCDTKNYDLKVSTLLHHCVGWEKVCWWVSCISSQSGFRDAMMISLSFFPLFSPRSWVHSIVQECGVLLKRSRVRTAVKGLLCEWRSEFQLGFLFISLFIQEERERNQDCSVRFGFLAFLFGGWMLRCWVFCAPNITSRPNYHPSKALELELITS